MKSISYILFSMILGFSSFSLAKIQDLNATLSAAAIEEKSDLTKLLIV